MAGPQRGRSEKGIGAAEKQVIEMDAWLDRLRKEIEDCTRGLSDLEWSRAPNGRWNSAEIMEHLGRTYGTTAKMLELSMDTGDFAPASRSQNPGAFIEDSDRRSGNFSLRRQVAGRR